MIKSSILVGCASFLLCFTLSGCDNDDGGVGCEGREVTELEWNEAVMTEGGPAPTPEDILQVAETDLEGTHVLSWNLEYVDVDAEETTLDVDVVADRMRSPRHYAEQNACSDDIGVPVHVTFKTADGVIDKEWTTELTQGYNDAESIFDIGALTFEETMDMEEGEGVFRGLDEGTEFNIFLLRPVEVGVHGEIRVYRRGQADAVVGVINPES